MAYLIKNGNIVTSEYTYKGDILIEGEKIGSIGKNLKPTKDMEIIDAKGKYVFPGGIDAHTHFELPFMGTVSSDDFLTGTKAAIFGGTTTIIDFVIPQKGKSLYESYKAWKDKAKKAVADYGFHMAIVEYNEKIDEEI
ncbi:MAG: amidohydrolase family protein, partial [Thermoplasmata archaeon]